MRTQRLRPTHWFNWLVLAVIFALFGMSPQTALAQCGDIPEESTCKTCHEEAYPVYGTGEWHDIHARKDCCWNCHGGNSQSMDQDIAHAGMTLNPLTDTYQDCYACHPYDYDDRAVAFGTLLSMEPGQTIPTPLAAVNPVRLPEEAREIVILPTSQPAAISLPDWLPVVSLLGLGVLVLVGLCLASHRCQTGNSSNA